MPDLVVLLEVDAKFSLKPLHLLFERKAELMQHFSAIIPGSVVATTHPNHLFSQIESPLRNFLNFQHSSKVAHNFHVGCSIGQGSYWSYSTFVLVNWFDAIPLFALFEGDKHYLKLIKLL